MHGFFHVLVIAGRGDRDAVLDEIELAVGLGHNEFAVRRVRPRNDVLVRILQPCREGIRGAHQRRGDQTKGEPGKP